MSCSVLHLTTVRSNAALPSLWKQIIIDVVGKSVLHDLFWHLQTVIKIRIKQIGPICTNFIHHVFCNNKIIFVHKVLSFDDIHIYIQ